MPQAIFIIVQHLIEAVGDLRLMQMKLGAELVCDLMARDYSK